jgi:hypothetical protein
VLATELRMALIRKEKPQIVQQKLGLNIYFFGGGGGGDRPIFRRWQGGHAASFIQALHFSLFGWRFAICHRLSGFRRSLRLKPISSSAAEEEEAVAGSRAAPASGFVLRLSFEISLSMAGAEACCQPLVFS